MILRVVPRAAASQDVEDALAYYLAEASEKTAMRFLDELQAAYAHIARYPETGSSRYAHELNLPGLHAWPVKRFPYVIFYVFTLEHVDVWRVLHAKRDIPAWSSEDETLRTEPANDSVEPG